jgi:NAD(P)H-flavin reductase
MYQILKKEMLTPTICRMEVKAPRLAAAAQPGQFLIVRADDEGERVPLTICDYDAEAGTVQIVFQVVGGESYRMSLLEEGDCFHDVVGPLGKPSDLTEMPIEELKKMKICFIAGGVGTAPVYCQLKWLHDNGVDVDCIDALTPALEAGSAKATNIVLMGRLSKCLDIDKDKWIAALKESVAPKFVEMNIKAFELGRA